MSRGSRHPVAANIRRYDDCSTMPQHCKQPQTSLPQKLADHLSYFMQTLLISAIRGYQLLLSPMLGGQCRFHPSCSHYAEQAIRMHGACKGLALTGGRIMRCNPCCEGGHDPVPDQFTPFKKSMP